MEAGVLIEFGSLGAEMFAGVRVQRVTVRSKVLGQYRLGQRKPRLALFDSGGLGW